MPPSGRWSQIVLTWSKLKLENFCCDQVALVLDSNLLLLLLLLLFPLLASLLKKAIDLTISQLHNPRLSEESSSRSIEKVMQHSAQVAKG